ncbi:GPN-loop GTPase 3-like [Prorops nasuta]|uniref:GPN-loop GTPase 3-like n=1 Tax=Prorops nasuta TaxID=863751 RepID=UPI0034CD9D79
MLRRMMNWGFDKSEAWYFAQNYVREFCLLWDLQVIYSSIMQQQASKWKNEVKAIILYPAADYFEYEPFRPGILSVLRSIKLYLANLNCNPHMTVMRQLMLQNLNFFMFGVFLIDSRFMVDGVKFLFDTMAALNVMIYFGIPHCNEVLSLRIKIPDLIKKIKYKLTISSGYFNSYITDLIHRFPSRQEVPSRNIPVDRQKTG